MKYFRKELGNYIVDYLFILFLDNSYEDIIVHAVNIKIRFISNAVMLF